MSSLTDEAEQNQQRGGRRLLTAAALSIALVGGGSARADVDSQGEIGSEGRVFLPGVDGDPANVSGVGRLSLKARYKPFKLVLRGFMRHDVVDRKRSAAFPEEAFVELKDNPFRLRIGYQLLNWTATEAFHPADIINSRYIDGDVKNPEKLGEPMVAVRYKFWDGNVEAYLMPLFVSPIFPSEDSRFRFGPEGLALGEPLVLDWDGRLDDGHFHRQWGARVQQTVGDADVSIHVVQHIDRSVPLLLVNFDPFGNPQPQLVYQAVTQFGGTYQGVWGPIIVKLEAAYRDFDDPTSSQRSNFPQPPLAFFEVPDRDHALIAAGVEYSYYYDQAQSTFLLEGQYAVGLSRSENVGAILLFDRDVLVGHRFALNDLDNKSVTAALIIDVTRPRQLFGSLVYEQRLGETWRAQGGFRFINFPPKDPAAPRGAEYLDDANYFHTSLIRYF